MTRIENANTKMDTEDADWFYHIKLFNTVSTSSLATPATLFSACTFLNFSYYVLLKPDKFYTPVSNILVTLASVLLNPFVNPDNISYLTIEGSVYPYFLYQFIYLFNIKFKLPTLAASLTLERFSIYYDDKFLKFILSYLSRALISLAIRKADLYNGFFLVYSSVLGIFLNISSLGYCGFYLKK